MVDLSFIPHAVWLVRVMAPAGLVTVTVIVVVIATTLTIVVKKRRKNNGKYNYNYNDNNIIIIYYRCVSIRLAECLLHFIIDTNIFYWSIANYILYYAESNYPSIETNAAATATDSMRHNDSYSQVEISHPLPVIRENSYAVISTRLEAVYT